MGGFAYGVWRQQRDANEYPFLARKTYGTPVHPPALPLHPDREPPPVFRVASSSEPVTVAARVSAGSAILGAAASSLLSLIGPSAALCQTSLEGVDPPRWRGWPHSGPASAFDCASLRRGFEVYRQVCSACHSMQWLHFRQLVGVTHTKEQAEALARSVLVVDGPNEEGEMFTRPGTLADAFPPPYPNEEFARYVNNGASDSNHCIKAHHTCLPDYARHRQEDYLFSLLTSYAPPPYGVEPKSGQHYNVYFPTNLLLMAPPLSFHGQVEYEDDTAASVSQMAKDVSCFLTWTANPDQDERKLSGLKVAGVGILLVLLSGWHKRFLFSVYKSRKIKWVYPKQRTGAD